MDARQAAGCGNHRKRRLGPAAPLPQASISSFVLSPTWLDQSTITIVVELYREDKLEASTTLATSPPQHLADTLERCRSHLQTLGMEERQASPSVPTSVSGSAED